MALGDSYKDELTEDELRALEGEPEPKEEDLPAAKKDDDNPAGTVTPDPAKPVQETEKPADKAAGAENKNEPEALTDEEKQGAESMGWKIETDEKGRTYLIDDDGSKIPPKRFRDVYRQAQEGKTAKEKLDLFKALGPEEFYRLYPDEAPEGWKPQQPEQRREFQPVPKNFDVLALPVEGGEYNGMTLREVMRIDPDEGTRMLNEWKDGQNRAIAQQNEKATAKQREYTQDADNFIKSRAKEFFNIEPGQAISADKMGQIMLIGQRVIEYQRKEGISLPFEKAYKLMMHDEMIAKAREEGTRNALKGLQSKGGPPSIDTGGGGSPKPSGWDAVEQMNEKQLERHIDKLSEAEARKFYATAPASVKSKWPNMPWD